MVKVRELARILNGINGDFEVESVQGVDVDFQRKRVNLGVQLPHAQPPPVFSEDDFKPDDRFFPAGVKHEDYENKDRFFPQGGGWTEENEAYYKAWKKGELVPEEKNPDYGSNTIPS